METFEPILARTLAGVFEPILEDTFTFEGGYQNFPNDSANYNSRGELVGTNRGISAKAYETYLRRPPTVSDMLAITPAIAADVYRKGFWNPIRGNDIKNQSVAHQVFDMHIASGGTGLYLIRQAIRQASGKNIELKRSALTPQEVQLINSLNQEKLFNTLKAVRLAFVEYLYRTNPAKYGTFINGWRKRIAKFVFIPQGDANKKTVIVVVVLVIVLAALYYAYRSGHLARLVKKIGI